MASDVIDVSTLTVAGTSLGLDSASPTKATAFAAGARQALIIVEDAPVYMRSDGDAATSADVLLNVGDAVPILTDNPNKTLDNLRFIRKTTTSATLKIIWYSPEAVLTERIIRGAVRLVTEAGDSAMDDTSDAVKMLAVTGSDVIGKVRLVDSGGTEVTEAVAHSVKVTLLSTDSGTFIGNVRGVLKEVRVSQVIDGSLGAYTAGDVVGADDCCTTLAVVWTFDVARAAGGYGYIVGATLVNETENQVVQYDLLLFNATPTGEKRDNFPNDNPLVADRSKYLGCISFPSSVAKGATVETYTQASPSTYGNLPMPFKCGASVTSIYGILVTNTVYTQTATDDIEICLEIEQY